MGEHNKVAINEVPEVAEYEAAVERLAAYRASNTEFFRYLDEIADDINTKLEAAEKAVRSKGVSCGSLLLDKYQRRYYPDKLYTAVGREKFLESGGKISTKTTYDCDKKRIDAAIASGSIDAELAEAIRVSTPVFSIPKKVQVP